AAAYRAGIISGKSNTRFAPEENLSRQEMAVIIYRAYQYATEQPINIEEKQDFKDGSTISHWAELEVAALVQLGLVQGRGNQMFIPHEAVTRAETAQMMSRLLESLIE